MAKKQGYKEGPIGTNEHEIHCPQCGTLLVPVKRMEVTIKVRFRRFECPCCGHQESHLCSGYTVKLNEQRQITTRATEKLNRRKNNY